MAIARPFAFNTGDTIPDMSQSGDLAIGPLTGSTRRYDLDYGEVKWYMGADETLGYIVGRPVPSTKKPTFMRSPFTDIGYLNMVNRINKRDGGLGIFNDMNVAKDWLDQEGYWTSFSGDSNMLTGWTNSIVNPYDTFISSGRSEMRLVNTGGLARIFSNERLVKGYGFNPGPPPTWGGSNMKIYITWNSGTADVLLQLYTDGTQESTSTRAYNSGNTVEVALFSGNIIMETAWVNYSITTSAACDLTITGAEWTITDGVPL